MPDPPSTIPANDSAPVDAVLARIDKVISYVIQLGAFGTVPPEVCVVITNTLTAIRVALTGDFVFAGVLLKLYPLPEPILSSRHVVALESETPDHV